MLSNSCSVFMMLSFSLPSIAGSKLWPSKLAKAELDEQQQQQRLLSGNTQFNAHHVMFDAPSLFHRQLELESCSSDSLLFADCSAATDDDAHHETHSVYDSCGIFLKPREDEWCILTPTESFDSSFRQVCCAEDVSECCSMGQTTLIGLVVGTAGFALAIVAIAYYLFCSSQLRKSLSDKEFHAAESSTMIYGPSKPDFADATTDRLASPKEIFVASTGPAPKEISPSINQSKISTIMGNDLIEL